MWPTPGGFRGLPIVKNLSWRTAPKFGTHVRIDTLTLKKNWPTTSHGGLGGFLLLKNLSRRTAPKFGMQVRIDHHHHQLPCLLQAEAIMTFHLLRSLASTIISAVLLPSQAAIPSCIFILWRPLFLFPSIFPVVNKCSSFPFLITWPRHYACLLLMLLISFLVLLAVFTISKLVLFFVHDTLSILLKNNISIASMDVDVCFVIDHDSHPYSSMDSM